MAPTVGEVVIIKSDERTRGKGKIGVIEQVIHGVYGFVRAAKVRTGTPALERAVQHLFPLELSCDKTQSTKPAKLNAEDQSMSHEF